MHKKIIKYFLPKKVEILVYKSNGMDSKMISFESYKVVERRTNWRRFNYKILDGKEMVHTSTVFSFSPTLFFLKLNGQLIGDCYTNPNYRGLSVYPRMLQYIVFRQEVCRKKGSLFVFVHPLNAASISGIEKAGFDKYRYLKARKWLCFFYQKELINY